MASNKKYIVGLPTWNTSLAALGACKIYRGPIIDNGKTESGKMFLVGLVNFR